MLMCFSASCTILDILSVDELDVVLASARLRRRESISLLSFFSLFSCCLRWLERSLPRASRASTLAARFFFAVSAVALSCAIATSLSFSLRWYSFRVSLSCLSVLDASSLKRAACFCTVLSCFFVASSSALTSPPKSSPAPASADGATTAPIPSARWLASCEDRLAHFSCSVLTSPWLTASFSLASEAAARALALAASAVLRLVSASVTLPSTRDRSVAAFFRSSIKTSLRRRDSSISLVFSSADWFFRPISMRCTLSDSASERASSFFKAMISSFALDSALLAT
mmetsp:Transcript_21873/g.45668  ORF Transcript_21873/g.45668 Transcript_21873/m.45668 type:complete len:285 (-) Transcript_21873:1174-2028(-)